MKTPKILGFALLAILLTACNGAATALPTEAEVVEPILEEEPVSVVKSPPASCSAASGLVFGDQAEESHFEEVSSADWVQGPDDATVTIVEYGDFQ